MPLLRISLADLSLDVFEAREKLRQILSYAIAWNAIVLLDNADVIMEERTLTDVNRNSLVSMFMTEIENFDGVMFLVTNRVGTFDMAASHLFQIIEHVPSLDKNARWEIWKSVLAQAAADGELITEEVSRYLQDYAERDMSNSNARQIKNSVNMAIALARLQNCSLRVKHIQTVLKSRDDFGKYIQSI